MVPAGLARNVQDLQLPAVLAIRRCRPDVGLCGAVAANPGSAACHPHLGLVLEQGSDLEAALVALRRTQRFKTGTARGEGPMTEAETEGLSAASVSPCVNYSACWHERELPAGSEAGERLPLSR